MKETGVKRKRPPTYQHLPINKGRSTQECRISADQESITAKRLKQTWVEKQKIKSKWKLEKRREGINTRVMSTEVDDDEAGSGERSRGEEELESASSAVEPKVDKSKVAGNGRPTNVNPHVSRLNLHQVRKDHSKEGQRSEPDQKDQSAQPAPSLRELTREAYSPSSLHTHKSNPLRRQGRGSRGRGGHESQDRGLKKGQPNMKLRMDAMLEKIKRDLT